MAVVVWREGCRVEWRVVWNFDTIGSFLEGRIGLQGPEAGSLSALAPQAGSVPQSGETRLRETNHCKNSAPAALPAVLPRGSRAERCWLRHNQTWPFAPAVLTV